MHIAIFMFISVTIYDIVPNNLYEETEVSEIANCSIGASFFFVASPYGYRLHGV
jgi:hypothetical protein